MRPVPYGIRRLLNYIREEFGDIPIWVSENGFEDNPIYDDYRRIFYLKSHLNEVLKGKTASENLKKFVIVMFVLFFTNESGQVKQLKMFLVFQ